MKHLQRQLNVFRFGPLVVDGIFGVATEEAVKKFQKYYGLTVDGIVGSQTWGVIDTRKIVRTTLFLGSTGEDVEYLQRRLNGLRYASLVVDGIFGVATEEAVKKFQKFNDLTVDGIVGPHTWAILELIDV
ncbi:MAG: peptidoglycan-binding protein [Okeania sp. SIO2G4]|nr:peptidoglycan-binding protein [Okeania sp. SIO4D6]NEP38020.1 peptidoglycan-binding protein [Okeania sp. SIO2H7]NEP75807.1 peptidoglycan-binding protein [Okeania sp. SIO2G5]NEP96982.1 peptidoglycan-binding protein [Okeania sp. SIO2F5]NEQ94623.1 peptidoglycan-binding protein [Okeania sp. SIO2G4]